MCLTEYDEKETMDLLRKEAFEDGEKKGAERGAKDEALSSARKMIQAGLTDHLILQFSSLCLEEIRQLREDLV